MARLSWILIHVEIESLRLEFHVLYLFLRSLFSFPIFLLFLVGVVPRPRMSIFSLFFNKTNKSHSFPIFLSSSSSPTHLSQTSKAPKNPRIKSNTKTDWIRNPNPKIKKIHSDEEDNEARNLNVDEPPRRWFRLALESQSWHRLGASWLFVSVCVLTLLLKLKWVCCSLWVFGFAGPLGLLEVKMGLLFVMGLWVCWVSGVISLFLSESVFVAMSLGLLKNAMDEAN